MARRTRKTQCIGAILRIILFICNGIVWGAALAALLGGLMVGFANKTFSMDAEEDDRYAQGDIRWRDFVLTTPATLLVYYGILMMLTTTFGCFAAAGAQRCCNITYIIAIVLLLVFDIAFGIIAFFDKWAVDKFMRRMEKAMDQYGTNKTNKIGVIPMEPKEYWDYLQNVGSCCGMTKYQDWRNRTIGKPENDYTIPDSCCNKDYSYHRCGWRVWAHNDGDYDHFRRDMMKRTGCISIFPIELTTGYDEVAYITICLGVLLIISLILAIVLLVFICMKRYRGHQGPEDHDPRLRNPNPIAADQPVLWTQRGRRDDIVLPLPGEDQNYKVNDPVYYTPEQLRAEREGLREPYAPDGLHQPPPERLPFSPRSPLATPNANSPKGKAANARQLYSPTAEKMFYNRNSAKVSPAPEPASPPSAKPTTMPTVQKETRPT